MSIAIPCSPVAPVRKMVTLLSDMSIEILEWWRCEVSSIWRASLAGHIVRTFILLCSLCHIVLQSRRKVYRVLVFTVPSENPGMRT